MIKQGRKPFIERYNDEEIKRHGRFCSRGPKEICSKQVLDHKRSFRRYTLVGLTRSVRRSSICIAHPKWAGAKQNTKKKIQPPAGRQTRRQMAENRVCNPQFPRASIASGLIGFVGLPFWERAARVQHPVFARDTGKQSLSALALTHTDYPGA